MIVYKPPGVTSLEIANKYKTELLKKKVCVCGKLDPMAHGDLLLLFDEDCSHMDRYLTLDKIYTFQILWGIKTDTDDVLGKIVEKDTNIKLTPSSLNTVINNYIGVYKQPFHNFSSIHIKHNGERKPLWKWTLENKLDLITIPDKQVSVKYIKLLNLVENDFATIKKNILESISNVKGDFRQSTIIDDWNECKFDKVYTSTFEAYVSTGFYIRQLVKDISNTLNIPGVTLEIYRQKIIE